MRASIWVVAFVTLTGCMADSVAWDRAIRPIAAPGSSPEFAAKVDDAAFVWKRALGCTAFGQWMKNHRIEIYGENGTLLLANATSDYMRGFQLSVARRPAAISLRSTAGRSSCSSAQVLGCVT